MRSRARSISSSRSSSRRNSNLARWTSPGSSSRSSSNLGGSRRDRPRSLRRVPRSRFGAARAQGPRSLFPDEAAELGEPRAGGGGGRAGAAPRGVPPHEGRRRLARRSDSPPSETAGSGSARRRSLLSSSDGSQPQDPAALAEALRGLAVPPPNVSLSHMALRFPPVSQFLERFRALLSRRRRFDFDAEVGDLSAWSRPSRCLALLELRKSGEIALSQAKPFAPIRVSRASRPWPATAPAERSSASPPPALLASRCLPGPCIALSPPASARQQRPRNARKVLSHSMTKEP